MLKSRKSQAFALIFCRDDFSQQKMPAKTSVFLPWCWDEGRISKGWQCKSKFIKNTLPVY